MYRDRPSGFGFTWEALLALAFTTHRYQRPIGGPDENLLRVGRDDILRFKETYYVPNNIVYVVVGDVSAEHVFASMEKQLGSWKRQPLEPDVSPAEPPQQGLKLQEIRGDVEKSYVKIGFHLPPELDPDTDAVLVLAHVLGAGRSSRLYRRVREDQGLILGAHTMETTGREPGYLVVEFSAEPEKTRPALDAVMREIQAFAGDPPTAAEMERTLRSVRNDTLFTLETMEGQAHMLGNYALLGDYRLAAGYLDRIARVTRERIPEVARRYLKPEQATVLVYGPEGMAPVAADAKELYRTFQDATQMMAPAPAAPAPAAAPAVLPAGSGAARGAVEALTLDSGTRVLLQRDGRLPLVALAGYLPGGSGTEPEAEAGVSRLAQTCLLKGAAGRTGAEIAESIDRLGARLRPLYDRDSVGFSLSAVRTDFDASLDLLTDILARPDFPADAVARERERTLVEIASLRDNTVPYTVSEFYRLIFPGHGYGRPSIGTESSVRGLEVEHLAARHAALYDPQRLVLGVVGDFDRDPLLRRLETLVRALPGKAGRSPEAGEAAGPTQPVRKEMRQDVSQAVVVLGYPGPALGAPERYALDVWNHILSGMGNRLFTRLRDEQHLCYFTGAFVSSLARGGAVGAYVGTGPEQVEEATRSLVTELERSARDLPTEEELVRAQNTLAGNYLVGMQTRMSWAATYAEDEILGLGFEEALRYVDEIRKVTVEDVRRAAAGVVDPGRLAVAVLRPSAEPVEA